MPNRKIREVKATKKGQNMEYYNNDELNEFIQGLEGQEHDGRPAMCRNCDYDCDEPDENGCPLMGL